MQNKGLIYSIFASFQDISKTYSKVDISEQVNPNYLEAWVSANNIALRYGEYFNDAVFTTIRCKINNSVVHFFFTHSFVSYKEALEFFQSELGKKFREEFEIDCHSVILIDPLMHFKTKDFDEFVVSLDFQKKYSALDFSHYVMIFSANDTDNIIEEPYREEWGFLEYTDEQSDKPWTLEQIRKAQLYGIYEKTN